MTIEGFDLHSDDHFESQKNHFESQNGVPPFLSHKYDRAYDQVRRVPEKMRLEMVIGMRIETLDGHSRSLFERLI